MAVASSGVNDDMLCTCMRARDYVTRSPTTAEIVIGVLFAPIWISWAVVDGLSGAPPTHYFGCP
jgi:hypothetical protein